MPWSADGQNGTEEGSRERVTLVDKKARFHYYLLLISDRFDLFSNSGIPRNGIVTWVLPEDFRQNPGFKEEEL